MQWFKGLMVVSSVAVFSAAALSTEGCSSPAKTDGGTDAIVGKDGSKTDGGGGDSGNQCTSGLSCEVCDVTGFSVSPMAKPFGPHANKCSAAQLTSFDTACLADAATQATCSTWEKDTNNSACLACVVTNDTGANWGPLVCGSTTCSLNVPGCLDLALNQVSQENGTNGSCGDLLNASYECQDYACSACNVAADGGSDPTSFSTCDNAALQAECKSYSDAFDSSANCSALQGDTIPTAVQVCFAADPQTGFTEQEVLNMVTYFCGQ